MKKTKSKRQVTPYQKYDRAFLSLFEEFRDEIGIQSKRDYHSDEKWTYKRPDTIIILEEGFDYTSLSDKVFPCLKEWNIIEFKSVEDELAINDIAKYLANTNLLSSQMFLDKEERALREVRDYVNLTIVSCNSVVENIFSDFKVSEYRKGFYELTCHSYFPCNLIVIDDLEFIRSNYPLLLLSNEDKQNEFWKHIIKELKRDLNSKETSELWRL